MLERDARSGRLGLNNGGETMSLRRITPLNMHLETHSTSNPTGLDQATPKIPEVCDVIALIQAILSARR